MAATLQDLRIKRGEISDKIDGILKAESLSAEQRTEVKTLETEFESLSTSILAGEKSEQEDADARKRASDRRQALSASGGRRTQPDDPGKSNVGNPREAWKEDPKKGFSNHLEFMTAVMDAGRGYGIDKRLQYLATSGDPQAGMRAKNRAELLAAGSDEARGIYDPTGGFLVPEGFSPTLLQVAPEDDPTLGKTTQIPMELPIVRIPARTDKNHTTSVSGGLTVTRRPETVQGTSSVMTLEQVVMQAHNLFGLSYATEELLTDSPISFAALLSAGFNQQFAYQLINEKLNGTGVGEFLGVLNSPALITIAKETGQASTTFVYENALKMRAQCWGYGKAMWMANHDVMPQLMLMNQAVGTGGAVVWQPSAREDAPDMLLGRPLFFSEYCQTLGTPGDIILANWGEYLEGTYQPMQSAESIHVRFVNHERTFKFWLRNAGQPWWRTALTPKYSASLLSPFVVCAAR